jgi:hypothetical protein
VSGRTKHILVVGLLVLAGLAAAVTVLGSTFLHNLGCTSGDGGVPYTAQDSPQKDLCELTGNGLGVFGLSTVAAVGVGMLAARSGRHWRDGDATPLPFIGLAVLTALSPLAFLWLGDLPSDGCTGEKLAAYEEWAQADSSGEPPYRCQKY